MLALCSMLHPTDYAKNYAGIMGTGLLMNLVQILTKIGTYHIIMFTGKCAER